MAGYCSLRRERQAGVDVIRTFVYPTQKASFVRRIEMPALIAAADIVLVPLKMYIPGAVPSKLYEAMASRRAACRNETITSSVLRFILSIC
jgi:hypothetical protein